MYIALVELKKNVDMQLLGLYAITRPVRARTETRIPIHPFRLIVVAQVSRC